MKALLVAKQTIRRMIRAYYLVAIGLISLLVMVFFFGQAEGAGKENSAILQASSFALFMITFFFLTIGSIWLAISIVPDELSSGHMRMNLTKPVNSVSVLAGHFIAGLSYLAFGALIMSLLLTVAIYMRGGDPGLLVVGYIMHLVPLYGCFLALGQALVMTMNRPVAVFMMFLLVNEEFPLAWADKAAQSNLPDLARIPIELIGRIGYFIAPPIARMKLMITEYADLPFPAQKYLLVLVYCLTYAAIALLISSLLLRKKEI